MKKIILAVILILGLCGCYEKTISPEIQNIFLKQQFILLEQQIRIKNLEQKVMEKTSDTDDMDAASEVGGSANTYDVNTTPSTTADYLLGIDDSAGSWAIQKFNITNLQTLFNALTIQITTPSSFTMSGAGVYGGTYIGTGATTANLPAVAVNMSFSVKVRGAYAVTLEPDGTDNIWLNGTSCTDGVNIVSSGTTGDIAVFQYSAAGDWDVDAFGFECGS